jgi:hypothetical protein
VECKNETKTCINIVVKLTERKKRLRRWKDNIKLDLE